MIRRTLTIAVAFAVLSAPAWSQTEPRFTHERGVASGGAGPRRLSIDPTLIAGGAPFRVVRHGETAVAEGGLGDLRLFDSANRPVPYLLIYPRQDPSWRTGTLLPVAATKTSSGFELDLAAPHIVDRLRVTGLPAPFLKRLRLEGSGDRSHWTLLQAEGTLFDLPDERIASTELPFPAGDYRYLRVTWNDTNSGRMPLPRNVAARDAPGPSGPALPASDLRFERRPSEPGVSRYRISLPAAHLPVIALDVAAGGDVYRSVTVWESRIAGSEAVPVSLGSGRLVRVLRAGSAAESMRIPIESPAEAEIELTVADGDNPPLDLRRISAVFAELPWIYFEAPSGSLVARYGDSTAAAPRYDLEAARRTIDLTRTPDAQWAGDATALQPAAARPASPISAGAVLTGSFPYTRAITAVAAPGLVALPLDAAVLSHSRGPAARFADVRILDASDRQVPYLLERRNEPLTVDVPITRVAPAQLPAAARKPSGNRTFYRLTLPQPNLPDGSLTIETTSAVFQRSIQLAVVRPADRNHREDRFEEVAATIWRHQEGQRQVPAVSLPVKSVDTRELWLVVDEGDNAELPLTAARLFLPSYRLRFFPPAGGALRLVYGRNDLQPPRYDLALLATNLMGAAATEVTAAPETSRPDRATFISPRWFWVLLSLSVLVLLVIIVRLARRA